MMGMTSPGLHPTKRHIEQGDIVLIDFPFSDRSATKRRPALVVSSSLYHQSYPDIILVPITSRAKMRSQKFDYQLKDWKTYGLARRSTVKMVIGTFEPSLLLGRLAKVSPQELGGVLKRLVKIFGINNRPKIAYDRYKGAI